MIATVDAIKSPRRGMRRPLNSTRRWGAVMAAARSWISRQDNDSCLYPSSMASGTGMSHRAASGALRHLWRRGEIRRSSIGRQGRYTHTEPEYVKI